ncbi:hypothetical protein EDB19DRAFT_1661190 [Suillus lakei]|nr:hypothetical protein EDB19DRAFT_1661190 [Suillus lakei]
MDVHENGLGRVIGCELRCIPPRFLESCWGLKWCPKFYARGPSDFDIGVLTPDGNYSSLKIGSPLAIERGARDSITNLKASPSLSSTIHDADGQLGSSRREPPSSWHFSVPTSPVYIAHEGIHKQPVFMRSDVAPAHSSAPLIAPGRTEGMLPIPIPELSYALLPGPCPHLSQCCGASTVGTPLHAHYLSPQILPAVSQHPDALLYSIAPENDASLQRLISDPGDAQAYYFPPDVINTHSTPQVHVMTPTVQTPQATMPDSWNNLDFSPASVTPMTCSTSFSTDCSLIGEFVQHCGPGVATPMSELMRMGLEDSPQSNVQLDAVMTDEYWQLPVNQTLTHSPPMHQSRGLSPIDMSVDQLPLGPSEGEETAYNISDTFLFSSAFHGAFTC